MPEAITGLVGVIIGALLAPIIEWARSKQTAKEEARYLAIRVVCILDEFIDKCVEVVSDDGQPDTDGCKVYQVALPSIDTFPEQLEWKAIDHKLLYKILSLPNKINSAKAGIRFACDTWIAPPYDDLGEERQNEFSLLGIYAADLADNLRQTYDIPCEGESIRNPEWNAKEFLKGKQNAIKNSIQKMEASSAKQFETL